MRAGAMPRARMPAMRATQRARVNNGQVKNIEVKNIFDRNLFDPTQPSHDRFCECWFFESAQVAHRDKVILGRYGRLPR
jgi:hypothetical protein